MDDWELLAADLDKFVTDKEVQEEKLRDPKDIREARKRFGTYLLKRLVKNLHKWDDENDKTPLVRLCKRTKLTQSEFRLHAEERDLFVKSMETGETYDEAKMKLKIREFQEDLAED